MNQTPDWNFTIDTTVLKESDGITVDDNHKWGYELRLVNTPLYCGKLIVLDNSYPSSLHYHKDKTETFIVLAGRAMIVYWIPSDSYEPEDDPHNTGICGEYGPGSIITMEKKQMHRFWTKDIPTLLLEVSTHHEDSDTYRA